MKKKLPYLDSSLSIEERVNDLIGRMTIDEKINQMFTTGINSLSELNEKVKNGEHPDISATFVYHEFDSQLYNSLQEYQIKNSRLKIPFILACEDTHGVSNPLCTIFPTTGCMAATFDKKLVGKAATASAKEAKILGISQVYAPNVDISWDLRWGRVQENFGEDPYLTAEMGSEIVKKYQKEKVSATVKHYIAYGLPENGINLSPAHIGERDIREYMLPPFEACIKKGKAWSLMPSYNEIDGLPVHSDRHWMKDVLRDELGFDGMIITDYGASNMMWGFHHIISKPVEAGKILCDNEVDMEGCSFFGYCDEFRQLVKSKKYPIANVDKCVKNILRLKFRLGLFENPYASVERMGEIHNRKNVDLAREIAEKGIVLLKNNGILPLKKEQKVAVIGPEGDISQLGNYIYYRYFNPEYNGKCVADESLTLKEVFEKSDIDCGFERGCDFHKTDEDKLERAYNLALSSDVVVLALGDNSNGGNCCGSQEDLKKQDTHKEVVTSGEGYDLNSIELTPAQTKLFDKVHEAGKPIVLIMYGGRPHAITAQVERCSGILFAFGAGEQGNQAIMNILYGKVNPSGKLPISFPRSTGHLPCYYNHKPSARGSFYQKPGTYDKPGRDYVFDSPNALYPFGFGLSYTNFTYSNMRIERKSGLNYLVKIDVENTGNRDGDEVVLLFLSCLVQPVTAVVKKLRGFKRVSFLKGEKKTVEFYIGNEDFSFVDVDYKRRVAKGDYIISIGSEKLKFNIS